jgi:hypothetical protein
VLENFESWIASPIARIQRLKISRFDLPSITKNCQVILSLYTIKAHHINFQFA